MKQSNYFKAQSMSQVTLLGDLCERQTTRNIAPASMLLEFEGAGTVWYQLHTSRSKSKVFRQDVC